MAILLEGVKLADGFKKDLKRKLKGLEKKGKTGSLVSVVVGRNQASLVYVERQKRTALEIGIPYRIIELSKNTSQEKLVELINELNKDNSVSGIILQLPLPPHVDKNYIQEKISPAKDAEGVNPVNIGKIIYGKAAVASPTALAAYELLKSTGVKLKGKEVVIVSHSEIIGKPLAMLLLSSATESPTVTVCHIATKDLAFHTRKADILFTAVGKPKLITRNMIKRNAIVIDIGICCDSATKRIVGDVDFNSVKTRCSFITPVPGGVGPLTVVMLMKNAITLAKSK